jgi:hypothetical protein
MDAGQVSDGYHTFNELYEHRCLVFLLLCERVGAVSWRPHYEGWDAVYLYLTLNPKSQISYHVPVKYRPAYEHYPKASEGEWDGHTSEDVVTRMQHELLRAIAERRRKQD